MRTPTLFPLTALTVLALAGCTGSPQHSEVSSTEPRPVRVAPALRVLESSYEEFMGTVTARSTSDIQAKLQARVERIDVVLGSKVARGSTLAQLDTREYKARFEQSRAVSEQAALELTRAEALLKQKAATQQEYDLVRSRRNVADAALAEAETYLSYATVTAPFSGTVTRRHIEVGDLAVPGKPLFTLEESGAQRFVVTLPESKLGLVAEGDSLSVSLASAGAVIRGRVEELSSSSDPVSRTFLVKVALPQVGGVHAGQFGRLLLPAGGDESLFIPRSALVKRGQLDLVYVATSEGRALLRLVRVGRQYPDRLEILSGLRENELVVTVGQVDLQDGDSVVVGP